MVLRAPTGGLWRHVVDLGEELAARGHRLGLVYDSGFSDPQTEAGLKRLEPRFSLGIHRFAIAREPAPSDLGNLLRLRRLARDLNVQIVHGHGAKGGLYARAAAVLQPQVSVYTPHGGTLNYAPKSLKGKVFRMVERVLMPATGAIPFESVYAKEAFSAQIAKVNCLSPVVHNGVGPQDFEPLQGSPDFDFVFVGELRPLKGIIVLIDALAEARTPEGRPATLIMAGGGPGEADLRAQIARLGLGDRVELAGVQPARKMFARGRCVVIPSLAESLPYIVLEAVAAGRPLLTTRVGGIAEIFGPTASELLPAGDVSALRHALERFLADPDAANASVAQRLAFVREGFTLSTMADKIEAVYRQIARA